VNAFFQELFRAGVYKRSQGRITRQVTWVAIAVILALGLWQLSGRLESWDPGIRLKTRAETAGLVKLTRDAVIIVDAKGQELERHEIPARATPTVEINQKIEAGTVLYQSDPLKVPWARAGLCFGLPGVLLMAGLWIAYRLVNLPAFADFLIAVEAEMNKVSWPSRAELFRASMVVLFTIFALAAVLFGFDSFWRWFFEFLKVFPQKGGAVEAAMVGRVVDWRVLLTVMPTCL
jgi:preprotein translocase SecE subunit